MTGKNVAVIDDVKAIPGTVPYPPADKVVSWTPGEVSYTSYTKLTVNGKQVISEAKCTFSFNGSQTLPTGVQNPVTGTETVTLVAKPTKLQGGLSQVLVQGDSQQSVYGNTLQVVATNKLFTA
ncbi:MAG: hypothetical protein VKL59_17875 [Nostocaceae cyanobacterium]|nr:hypothetical protein [Nostocaceae cyanobacterium]